MATSGYELVASYTVQRRRLVAARRNKSVKRVSGLNYKPGVWVDCTNRSGGLLFKDLRCASSAKMMMRLSKTSDRRPELACSCYRASSRWAIPASQPEEPCGAWHLGRQGSVLAGDVPITRVRRRPPRRRRRRLWTACRSSPGNSSYLKRRTVDHRGTESLTSIIS